MGIPIIIAFVLYFILHFVCTQIIYNKNYFVLLFSITLSLPIIFLFFLNEDKVITILNAGLNCFYYVLLLFIVKKTYKLVNRNLIQKGFLDKIYSNKDFTYIYWDGDIPSNNSWNEKLASKPSWLDKLLTYILIILPILIFWLINFLTID